MAVPRSRILDLLKVQSRIFNTTFNPTNARLGNSVLRQRLRGPSLAAYYPRRVATFKDLRKLYPEFELYDNFEEDRLEHIQISKSRGKGAPKKKRTAAESRKNQKGKKR
ncbi:probable RSM27 Mitochondrial ribosomal protein, small subunit [Ramularia collo-cygni]|uniref:Small ribosomal subunit protein mS33 n=1 Tax=Ramularia collo-cygni TaxID=112498 RepID=A0A2D3VEZ7_9PEZI|nr:probable RSM27 Mitochondrial ribosomal protein, small subunit [Ramularia collo-cygni]CZT21424.1 probable RSM27 Mitochondrial ribosomal protein, small subunit [Ramularia collo-cygni]